MQGITVAQCKDTIIRCDKQIINPKSIRKL
nr:MAG TPA: hypothetical protein [Crassvirales sp.]